MSFESMKTPPTLERPKKIKLSDLLSNVPVQGVGYERFTQSQKNDLEALFSLCDMNLDSPAVDFLLGEDLMNMMEYVKTEPRSDRRKELAESIKDGLRNAQEQDWDQHRAA